MSILIKGMEMPEFCEVCPCYNWVEDICRITDSPNDFTDTRVSDCPLVEVPTPHGRLIDDFKLLRALIKAFPNQSMNFYDTLERVIDEAPTIIEAEVSENA